MKSRLCLLACLLTVFVAACSERSQESSTDSSAANPSVKELDDRYGRDIKSAEAAEARAWLQDASNSIKSKAEVVSLTEEFYKAGCSQVYVTDIVKIGGKNLSESLVVVLPTDPSQRKAAFEVQNTFAKKKDLGVYEDKGQKYMWIGFD